MGRFLGILFLLLTAMALPDRVHTAAVITGFKGDVKLQVGKAWLATEPFLPLTNGTQLKLSKGSSVSFCLMTGGRRATVSGPSRVTVLPDKIVVLEGGPSLLRYQDPSTRASVPVPNNLDLERMGGRWRGEISLYVDPGQQESKIRTHWSETLPFESFRLQLASTDDEKVVEKVDLPASTHQYTFDFGFTPGASYFVKITGRTQGREVSTTAIFRTLTPEENSQLASLQENKEELLLGYLAYEAYEPALKLAGELQRQYPKAAFLGRLVEALQVRTGLTL